MAYIMMAMLLWRRGPRLVVSMIEHRIDFLLLPQMALRLIVLVKLELVEQELDEYR